MELGPVFAAAGELLLGASCHGCGVAWWGVCPECRDDLGDSIPFRTAPTPSPPGFPPTVASAPYDPVVRSLISAHKDREALGLAGLLSRRLALAVAELLAGPAPPKVVYLVPVPSSPAAVRRRGYDATWTLAARAARQLRGDYGTVARRWLVQRRTVRDQSGLGAEARAANLRGSLRARPTAAGRTLVIVDDVVTTGSSLTEAARALRAAGADVLGAATIAATRLNRPVG